MFDKKKPGTREPEERQRESHSYRVVCESPAKGCFLRVFIECCFERINKMLMELL